MTIETFTFGPTASMPNSDLPLIVMTGEIAPELESVAAIQRRFRDNGWQGSWVYTVFDYWHFHLEGHEVLTCVSGEAVVGFGGDEKDGGIALTMRPGDTAIVPAGVGHKRLSGSSDFQVAGAYPPGQNGAISRAGSVDIGAAKQRIAELSIPETDPITGETPGSLRAWHGAAE